MPVSNVRLPRPLDAYARAVFDCDGVILDSNGLKSHAMGAALEGEPVDRREAFVAYHRAHGGVSRYVKFAHYFERMYPTPNAEARTQEALERYAALVEEGLRRCEELPGIRSLLGRMRDAGIACFVNSGGDEAEVRAAMAERGLAPCFAGIFGSPATKHANLARIAGIDDGMPGLFLGDAKSDFDAAVAFGLEFVFVAARSEWADGLAFCAERGAPVIQTPADIATIEPGTDNRA